MTPETQNRERPLVTICMPVYEGATWIRSAIESCLGQTQPQFELLVVDNASRDETVSIARSFDDPRVRVLVNPSNVGMMPNHNRAVTLARGEFIKFLHADDLLSPNCLEEMLRVARRDERIGMVFSRRRVKLPDELDLHARAWLRDFGDLHSRFEDLREVNDGPALLEQWLDRGFGENWIGEPSAVLVRASCFERLGGFNPHIRVLADVDMWARIMSAYQIGFIDQELCTFLHHQQSATARSMAAERQWLDRLWIIESLLRLEQSALTRSRLRTMRRTELRWAVRSLLRRGGERRRRTGELSAYVATRLRGAPADQ
jgi:glycosyltransferase involved in cell wall biosynthesis